MRTFETKKKGVHKKQGCGTYCENECGEVTLIPFMHVSQPSFEIDGYWIVRSHCFANVEYKMKYNL